MSLFEVDQLQPDKSMLYKVLIDFVFGGLLISVALFISEVLGPIAGGGFAALPVRVGATIFIAGVGEGKIIAYEMTKGALSGLLGAFSFAFLLSFAPKKIGLFKAIIVALLLCAVVVYVSNPIIVRILL